MPVHSVLYVVSFAFPGTTGTPLHAMGMAQAMRGKGLDVRVAQLRPWPLCKSEENTWKGIPVYRLARPGWGWRLHQLLRTFRPDVVHAHHIAAAVLSLGPCRRAGAPLLYECHSFWREEMAAAGRRPSLYQRYYSVKEKAVFAQSDHIIALSEKMKRTHVQEMGVSDEKITVIYPGVKPEWIGKHGEPAAIPGVEPGDLVAMYSGNFAGYQGVDLLLAAFAQAMEACPGLKLVLVGGSEAENARMKALYPEAGPRVVYLGRRPYEEMPALMARADVLLIPRPDIRICWTMPRKFGEYLSAGRPLLVTGVGDHRRVIDRFGCGIVAESTPAGIADGLVRFAGTTLQARQEMGCRALSAAREWFDWEKQMDRFVELYETILARPAVAEPALEATWESSGKR
jgi:glycosyltransferase involved in cell wall biosynthesis